VRGPAQLTTVTNGTYRIGARGVIAKRYGFTKLATTVQDQGGTVAFYGEPKGLFSTGTELCVRGYRNLYTWNTIESVWYDRGTLSPFTGELTTMFHDQRAQPVCDHAELGSYRGFVSVAMRQYDELQASTDFSIEFRCETTAGEMVLQTTIANADDSAADMPHAARIATCTGKFLIAFVEDDAAGPVDLRIYQYPTATPTTAPTLAQSHADLYNASSQRNTRYYDIIALDDGNYAYAYIEQTSQDIEVHIRDSSHASQATLTINAAAGGNVPYDYVSICQDVDNARLYLIAVANATEPTVHQVEMWALDDTNLTALWGPINLYTIDGSGGEFVFSLGCVAGIPTGAVAERAVGVWGIYDADQNDSEGNSQTFHSWRIDNRSTAIDGSTLDDRDSVYNALLRTKPWVVANRFYMGAASAMNSSGNDSQCVIDLGVTGGTGNRPHAIVGMYDVGVAPAKTGTSATNDATRFGSANSVSIVSSVARFGSVSVAYDLGSTSVDQVRFASDLVALDYTAKPLNAQTTHGCQLIGGGLCEWYAGITTQELGSPTTPVIAATRTFNGTGVLSNSTAYQYRVMWEGYDERGNWHRSPSSASVTATTGASDDTIDIIVPAMGTSNSIINTRSTSLVVYRANSDGVYVRISDAIRAIPNADTYFCDVYRDIGGTDVGESIYTEGGAELAAVAPEGADIMAIGPDRVWLSGFYRRDRVQYSKKANPGTANEDAIAPEFNDSFALIIPGGKRCTGIALLDDKKVVFTNDEIYAVAGFGPDDGGAQDDFSGLQRVSSDAGCIEPRSVVDFPGGVAFQSEAGIYALTRSLEVVFIGEAIAHIITTNPTITSAVLVPKQTHLRFTAVDSSGDTIIIVYDYAAKVWVSWIPLTSASAALDVIGACVHADIYYVLEKDGTVWKEDSSTYYDDVNNYPPLTIELSWLQSQPNGWQRARNVAMLGQRKNPHDLTMSVYNDFETTASQSVTWSATTIAAMADPDAREQLVLRIKRQKASSHKVKVVDAAGTGTTTAQGYTCAGFTFEIATKAGVAKTGSQGRN